MAEDNSRVWLRAKRVTMRTRPWLAAALGWVTALLAMLPLIIITLGAALSSNIPSAEYLFLSWIAALLSAIAVLVSRAPWSKKARVTTAGGRMTFTDTQAAPHEVRQIAIDEVVHCTVIPGFGTTLSMKDGSSIDVEVESTRDAEQLAAACKVGSSQRRFETRLNPAWARPRSMGFAALGLLGIAARLGPSPSQWEPKGAVVWGVTALAMLGGMYLFTNPAKVEVGVDGVKLREVNGSRFVHFEDISRVAFNNEETLTLRLHDGESVARVACSKQETSGHVARRSR